LVESLAGNGINPAPHGHCVLQLICAHCWRGRPAFAPFGYVCSHVVWQLALPLQAT
jgi:hypothetical protein